MKTNVSFWTSSSSPSLFARAGKPARTPCPSNLKVVEESSPRCLDGLTCCSDEDSAVGETNTDVTCEMLARRVVSVAKDTPKSLYSSSAQPSNEGKSGFARKAVTFVLVTVTGGVALSALDDLAIYHACSSKAMDKASKNKVIIDALGEPIKKGPWYNASLAVAHQRHSASCTFPVSGPQGSGIFQLKAVRNGDDTWLSYLRPRDWEILIMEALLHVPENEEKQRTFRISLSDDFPPPDCKACTSCSSSEQKHGETQKSSASA